jgi:hypothetical protein
MYLISRGAQGDTPGEQMYLKTLGWVELHPKIHVWVLAEWLNLNQ